MSSLRDMTGEAVNALIVFVGVGVSAFLCVGNGVNTENGFISDFTLPLASVLGLYIRFAVEERQLILSSVGQRLIVVFGTLATVAVLMGQWFAVDPSPVSGAAASAMIFGIPSLFTAEMYVDIPVFTRLFDDPKSKEVSA